MNISLLETECAADGRLAEGPLLLTAMLDNSLAKLISNLGQLAGRAWQNSVSVVHIDTKVLALCALKVAALATSAWLPVYRLAKVQDALSVRIVEDMIAWPKQAEAYQREI